jgi:surface protein
VDWGDGSAPQTFSSATTAYKQYDYNNAALNNTDAPVTFSTTSNLVTRNNHGYSNGMEVRFYNISGSPGIPEGQIYYVVNATTNTFQISSTVGGSPLSLNMGTGTLLPHKQVMVTVTTGAGGDFTQVQLNVKHNKPRLQKYDSGFLDLIFNRVFGSAPTIGSTSTTSASQVISFSKLERVQLLNYSPTSSGYLFSDCTGLRSVNITTVGSFGIGSSANGMFYNCYSLTEVPLFDTQNVSNMSNMFYSCRSLTTVPLFNTAAVTNMKQMFYYCPSLTSVPVFNTAAVTDMSYMFWSCFSLTSVPLFNTAAVTTISNMLYGCSSLTSVPLFNTAAVTNMSFMFYDCSSLTSVPLFNTAAVTDMSYMLYGCSSLTSVPLFNTAAVTNMSSMFSGCISLVSVPLFNTAAVTDMTFMFNYCYNIRTVPLFNTAAVTNMLSMFDSCIELTTVPLFNTQNVVDMSSMFRGCRILTTVPLFDTTKVRNMSAMFNLSSSLISIPKFDTSAVTRVSNMFNTCSSLVSIPELNLSGVTLASNITGMISSSNSSLVGCDATGIRATVNFTGCKLSPSAIENIFNKLGKPASTTTADRTITFSSNWGTTELHQASLTVPVPEFPAIQATGTTTLLGTSIAIPSANATLAGISVGMQWTGASSPLTVALTGFAAAGSSASTNTIFRSPNPLQVGDQFSFSTMSGVVSGITTDVIYHVVERLADNTSVRFSSVSGGSPISFFTSLSPTFSVRYPSIVTAVTNSNITVSRGASVALTGQLLLFQFLPTRTALLKGWGVVTQ